MVDTYRRLLEIFGARGVDVDEPLRITIYEWEPGGLNLDHQAMARQKGMTDVVQLEFDLLDPVRR